MKNLDKKMTEEEGAALEADEKKYEPTDDQRRLVESMAGYGVPQIQIAALVGDGIHVDTLVKYFGAELAAGKAKASAKIGQTLFQKATSGDTTALIWWTKAQMGWKEKKELDHTSSDGSMTPKEAGDSVLAALKRKHGGDADRE